jgi:hypothetical protein
LPKARDQLVRGTLWRFSEPQPRDAKCSCLFRCGSRQVDVVVTRNRAPPAHLTAARPEFPAVLGFRGGDGLPLQVRRRVRTAAGEGLYVILAVAGQAARVLPFEGQGRSRRNSRVTSRYRGSFAESGAAASATAPGDGLRDQAAAVWDCEDAGWAATSIPSVNRT